MGQTGLSLPFFLSSLNSSLFSFLFPPSLFVLILLSFLYFSSLFHFALVSFLFSLFLFLSPSSLLTFLFPLPSFFLLLWPFTFCCRGLQTFAFLVWTSTGNQLKYIVFHGCSQEKCICYQGTNVSLAHNKQNTNKKWMFFRQTTYVA